MKLLVFTSIFSTFICFQTVRSNYETQLDSILMSESLLDPKAGLFAPKHFNISQELCKNDTGAIKCDFSGKKKSCKRKDLTLDFENEEEMAEVCENLEEWKSCGRFTNPCFKELNKKTSIIQNKWKFTEKFTELFCEKRRWFLDDLIRRDVLVCSTPKRIGDINKCNYKAENFLEADPAAIDHDINDFCVKFRIMELCVKQRLATCCCAESVSKLINDLKRKMKCEEYNFNLEYKLSGTKASYSSKYTILLTCFYLIVSFL